MEFCISFITKLIAKRCDQCCINVALRVKAVMGPFHHEIMLTMITVEET